MRMQPENKIVVFVAALLIVGIVWLHKTSKSRKSVGDVFLATFCWCTDEILPGKLHAQRSATERNLRSQIFTDRLPTDDTRSIIVQSVEKSNDDQQEKQVVAESSPQEQQKSDKKKEMKKRKSDLEIRVRRFEGEENLSSMDFHLMLTTELETAFSSICSSCKEEFCSDCEKFDTALSQLKEKESEMDKAKLYVIPLDPLVWMSSIDTTAEQSTKLSKDLIEGFHSARSYLRFKGSDHILLCLTNSCAEFASEFVVDLSESKGTRVILASVNASAYEDNWPCPLRLIDIPATDLVSVHDAVNKVINRASYMIFEGNRWVCSDESHPENHWYELPDSQFAGGIFMLEYDFLMCSLPKVGSSMINMFMRRAMHFEDWRRIGGGFVHRPQSGLMFRDTSNNLTLVEATFENPSFIKAAVVRNPAPRLISAYLNKIVNSKRYNLVPGLTEFVKEKRRRPTFEEFVDFLIANHPDPNEVDQHFRLQSSFCGLRSGAFDFVGDLEALGDTFVEFAKSVDIWEEYGADGWGTNHDEPFVNASAYKYGSHHSAEKLWEYYTEDLLKKVYNYYKEDFDLFGFSIEPILAAKPSNFSVPLN